MASLRLSHCIATNAQKRKPKSHHFNPARQRTSTVAAQGYASASIRGRAPSMARSPVDVHSRSSRARCVMCFHFGRKSFCLSVTRRNTFNASVLGTTRDRLLHGCSDRAPKDGFTACPVGCLAPAYGDARTAAKAESHHFNPARQRTSTVAAQGYAPASIRGRAPSMARSPADVHSRSSRARCGYAFTSGVHVGAFTRAAGEG